MNNLIKVNLDTLEVIKDLIFKSNDITITHDWIIAPDGEVKSLNELFVFHSVNTEMPIDEIENVVVFIENDMLYIGDYENTKDELDNQGLIDSDVVFPHVKVGDEVEFKDGEIIIINHGYIYSEEVEVNGHMVSETLVWKIKY